MAITLLSCAEELPPFPATSVYIIHQKNQTCHVHYVDEKDPLKFDNGQVLRYEECPPVFGFTPEETGAVMNWIRNVQQIAKERCK